MAVMYPKSLSVVLGSLLFVIKQKENVLCPAETMPEKLPTTFYSKQMICAINYVLI